MILKKKIKAQYKNYGSHDLDCFQPEIHSNLTLFCSSRRECPFQTESPLNKHKLPDPFLPLTTF